MSVRSGSGSITRVVDFLRGMLNAKVPGLATTEALHERAAEITQIQSRYIRQGQTLRWRLVLLGLFAGIYTIIQSL